MLILSFQMVLLTVNPASPGNRRWPSAIRPQRVSRASIWQIHSSRARRGGSLPHLGTPGGSAVTPKPEIAMETTCHHTAALLSDIAETDGTDASRRRREDPDRPPRRRPARWPLRRARPARGAIRPTAGQPNDPGCGPAASAVTRGRTTTRSPSRSGHALPPHRRQSAKGLGHCQTAVAPTREQAIEPLLGTLARCVSRPRDVIQIP